MSAFDGGSVIAKLGLDNSGYMQGMLEATGISQLFPAVVTDFLANPLLGWAELAKEAIESVKSALEGIVETVKGVGESFHQIGLEAQKTGVDVKWLSELKGPAEAAGLSLDQLSIGLKSLENAAEQAQQGDKKAIEGFNALGISIKEAAELASKPQELFERVRQGIEGISDPSQRTAAALEVMGRQGFNLVPLLTMSQQKMDEMKATMTDLGAVVDTQDAAMGEKFGELQTVVGGAWEGIKASLAQPILQYVSDHFTEIVETIKQVAGELREVMGNVGGDIAKMIPDLIKFGAGVVEGIIHTFHMAWPIIKGVGEVLMDVGHIVVQVLTPAFKVLGAIIEAVLKVLEPVLKGASTVLSWLGTDTGDDDQDKADGSKKSGSSSSSGSSSVFGDAGGSSDSPLTAGMHETAGAIREQIPPMTHGLGDVHQSAGALMQSNMDLLGFFRSDFMPNLEILARIQNDMVQMIGAIIVPIFALVSAITGNDRFINLATSAAVDANEQMDRWNKGRRTDVNIDTIHVDAIDVNDATTQIAEKLRNPVLFEIRRQRDMFEAAIAQTMVRDSFK